ncbi:extracellular solute-binding protein [Paenibacillus psychroresistens]|uniref:Extracellular solute-binding protein n=1 Tax=Paenibacillus psychroresistens TaxID=1778678 RepID=A0A6B8RRU5_9BACL|nr:extracellular solute-binding protein [Paenibacillus psychroresistens]QGQ98679.1 extracellular solute-binding protein [Paenibacillus psychroresistens]
MIKSNKFKATMVLMLCCFMLVITACGSKAKETAVDSTATAAPSTAAATSAPVESAAPAKIIDINFYGKIVEYTSGEPMVKALQEDLKDKYKIEGIQVDWGNLEKVIKTGIASGTPADVYQFWPGNMKTFVDNNQALDLTPYLEADGGAWMKTFTPALLDIGKFNGKYYNLPLSSNFATLYVNTAIFEKAGVAVPDQWTWEQFLTASKTIKDKTGAFPFVISKDLQDWLFRNGLLSVAKSENKLADLGAGKIPATDPMFATVLTSIKQLFDAQYAYPGAGAITISRDEAKAAFYQGKVAMLAEVSANVKDILTNAKDFKATAVVWPSVGKDNAILGGADGLFIPANAPHPEASVEVLKAYLGTKIQKIHADLGYATANVEVQVTDPTVNSIMKMAAYIYPTEFTSFSPKITDYVQKELLAALVLGGKSNKDIQEALEKLRLAAAAK